MREYEVIKVLYLLTGEIQTGKTRWLESLVDALTADGTPVFGVLAPGVWREVGPEEGRDGFTHDDPDGIRREKTGIDNLLLPERRTVPFARRTDLVEPHGKSTEVAENNTGARTENAMTAAPLAWAFSEKSIAEVNAHFDRLVELAESGRKQQGQQEPLSPAENGQKRRGLIVIDEFGQLELLRGSGLSSAVSLLDLGPTPLATTAILVVRQRLLDVARERFRTQWPEQKAIAPSDEARREIVAELAHR